MKQVEYTAAGGVVVYGGKALVLYRPSRNEVRLPKGHLDEGEDFETAAKREVTEESGYANLNVLADLGSQRVEFSWEGKSIQRTEVYFLMGLEEKDFGSKGIGEEEFEPRWITFDEALFKLSFEAEREWIRRGKSVASNFCELSVEEER